MNPLISPAEAAQIISRHRPQCRVEQLPLLETLGRTLAEDVAADRPFPPYRRAMMDGICCRREDAGTLAIHSLHAAGAPEPEGLPRASCYEIMTGAVVPDECDLLVPYEDVTLENGVATITEALPPDGAYIHQPGSDAAQGDVILKTGTVLTPPCLGIAASAGRETLSINAAPRVGILSTGDELVEISETPQSWQIRRSNPIVLSACLQKAGVRDISTHTAEDSLTETVSLIEEVSARVDILLISGGISKGKRDFIRPALESLYGQPLFHGVSQRPGKPFGCWKAEKSPLIFALPGNPTSAMTCCLRYVIPTICPSDQPIDVILAEAVTPHPQLTLFLPAQLADGHASPVYTRNSGDEVSPTRPHGFLHIPPGSGEISAGRALPFTSYL